MTVQRSPDRNKVHELRGIASGLEFLGARLSQKRRSEDRVILGALADAVARYAVIIEGYAVSAPSHGDLIVAQSSLLANLREMIRLLQTEGPSTGADAGRMDELVAASTASLRLFIAFYS